jgi:molecular chaperone Hsp33
LFASLSDAELLDPALGGDVLLYRLFHQEGARMGEAARLRDACTCNAERLSRIVRQFPPEQVRELLEPDGFLHAKCQFCARAYLIAPESLSA